MNDGLAYWQRHARRYDRSTRMLARPVPRMLELARSALTGRARVLEVGAGTGLLTAAIAPVVETLVATDYAEAMLGELTTRVRTANLENVTCQTANLQELPFADGSFDAVLAANVLHLVPDLTRALASARRVLAPGGLLVAPTYLHRETWRAAIMSRLFALTGFPGARRFSLGSLVEALTAHGFAVDGTETIAGPLPIGFVTARAS